jgi:hypothetical protein
MGEKTTCNDCVYCNNKKDDTGICYRLPPVVDDATRGYNRPLVLLTDIACGEFDHNLYRLTEEKK